MNNRKAKALRKIVFAGQVPAPKYSRLKSTGQIIHTGDMETIVDSSTGHQRDLPKRRIYQHLKRIARGLPIKQLEKVFLNDKKVYEPNAS